MTGYLILPSQSTYQAAKANGYDGTADQFYRDLGGLQTIVTKDYVDASIQTAISDSWAASY